MPQAARVGDSTSHGGALGGPGVTTVLIGGKPAATQGAMHACPITASPPHGTTAITLGSTSVLIGGQAAARVGDSTACGASIVAGALDVEIGG